MVEDFMKSTSSSACIAGFAGVGKTSLMKYLPASKVVIAPTGKAAVRIEETTGLKASTIHRWMYTPKEDKKGNIFFERKPLDSIKRGDLIVIDEASMIDSKLYSDIVDTADALHCKTLFVGDPFQLPPVNKGEFDLQFSALSENLYQKQNYILIKEIVRQALDSPIIRASVKIRNRDIMGGLKELTKLNSKDIIPKALELGIEKTSIICHTNNKRFEINDNIRTRLGYVDLTDGDQLLVTKNNYDLDIFNGEVHQIEKILDTTQKQHEIRDTVNKKYVHTYFHHLRLVGGSKVVVAELDLNGKLPHMTKQMSNKARLLFESEYLHCNYGYATTAHKFQGSQNNNICILMEPSIRPSEEEGARWMYVAVTRAIDSCYYSLSSSL
jgi:ATP-dependent exoDNAse (exonuclease V) alpha subunit